jgi:tetratricopeptide (TPR) repeat protein
MNTQKMICLLGCLFLLGCGNKKTESQVSDNQSIVKVEEANLDQLNLMLEKEPQNPEYLYYRGLKYMDADDYTQAISDFNQSIALDSSVAATWFNRGTSKFSIDDFEGALADYNRAVAIKPGYVDAFYNRGVLFDTKGDYESAIADYTKVLELKPDYLDALYYRGVDYLQIKKKEMACDDFKKLADLDYEDGKNAYQKYCLGNKNK